VKDALVIGTAGHIDHGKTSLVRALTGVDLDRAPEERQRGITINLGFTHLDLPSGRRAAFIDVPGHEKLIRTMVAGASGLDVVLLCVSAMEGAMPQTREHLSILGLLGVKRGIVALTMTDLADEEMLELATMDVEELVEGSFLEGAPIIPTAAGPDSAGIPELIAALDRLPSAERSEVGPFRLPVDRVFIQRGFGTVVTGTSRTGRIRDGDEVEILPKGLHGRIRGMQMHGLKTAEAGPGQRIAINLAGVHHEELGRGDVVAPRGTIPPASVIDAEHRHLEDAPILEDGSRVRVLCGSAEALARLTVVDGEALLPGETSLVQLRLDHPVAVLPGDRLILRRESPLQTLGGGRVLDPWSRRIRQRDKPTAMVLLRRIQNGDRTALLERCGAAGAEADIAALWQAEGFAMDGKVYSAASVAAFRRGILEGLEQWHEANPLQAGAVQKELHNATLPHLSERAFGVLLEEQLEIGAVERGGGKIHSAGFQIRLSPEQESQCGALLKKAKEAGLEGAAGASMEPQILLHLLLEREALHRIGKQILHPDLLEGLVAKLRVFFENTERLSPMDFKEITGLSRKFAIPMLEWLDERKITRRRDNFRIPG
jgi:selenocysteine-specific elongation factor